MVSLTILFALALRCALACGGSGTAAVTLRYHLPALRRSLTFPALYSVCFPLCIALFYAI
jgi:hypothetical protein